MRIKMDAGQINNENLTFLAISNQIGLYFKDIADNDTSLKHFENVLIRKNVLLQDKLNHPIIATILNNIGIIYRLKVYNF
jgi:hypothetical protein